MPNSKELFHDLVNKIQLEESLDEIKSIAYLILENLFDFTRTEIFTNKPVPIDRERERRLTDIIQRINAYEPIQYVLGEADFFGRKFKVNPFVLIPRPETEELVKLILKTPHPLSREARGIDALRILDIGTGSGCIPITLSLEISDAEVFATDISLEALSVAKENAAALNTRVTFAQQDILSDEIPFRDLDIIVSNPPYVMMKEKELMTKNVLNHEPHLALFVPNEDSLIFYKVIVQKAAKALMPAGSLWVEINEQFGKEVAGIFTDYGFLDVKVIQDLAGKDRIVKGILN